MGHVFVSYSRRNKEFVDSIVTDLEKVGLSVWIDREDIKAGKSWRVQIVEAIDTCDAFILMLSSYSALSENVQKEIDLAQDSGRKTFVFLLEQIRLPAEIKYQLAGLQFIDAEEIGLEEAIKRLLDVVQDHVSNFKTEKKSNNQAELVIEGVDLQSFDKAKQDQLLEFIAQLSNTDTSKLKIANLTAGSIHAFVDMPSNCAFQLKTMALNRDERFKQMNITAIKLAGDSKYVLPAIGALSITVRMDPARSLWLKILSIFSSIVGTLIGRMISLVIMLAALAGLVIFIPSAIIPTFFPSSTPTPTNTFTPTTTSTTTSTATPTATLTLTPALTSIPSLTFTPTLTPTLDRRPNAVFEFIDGNTTELKNCTGTRYAVNVVDPEGVVRVIVQFHVDTKEPDNSDFRDPDEVLKLVNEKENLWSGFFKDNISRSDTYTYWRFVAYDENEIPTVFYIPGVFRFYSGKSSCGVIPQ